MKKNYLFVISALFAFTLSSCGYKVPNSVEFNNIKVNSLEIHTTLQKGLIESTNYDVYLDDHSLELTTFSNSAPLSVDISYEIKTDTGASGTYYVITSETQDFANSYEHPASGTVANLYNLKLGKKYYYKVKGIYKDKVFESEIKELTTNNVGPRNINAPGVENVRDLGGYTLEDGRKMKQGMVYRTAQFNYDHSDKDAIVSEPTSEGIKVLVEQLGIKSDIDVREKQTSSGKDETAGCTSSPLGASVNYVSLPMKYGGQNVLTNTANKESLKAFFEYCAVESNYPIAFHCVRGTDRTGALAYALCALCGMNEEDLMLDYLFSNFANIGGAILTRRKIEAGVFYVEGIKNASGATMSEKAKNYLMSYIDVSENTLDSIIGILAE